MSEAPETSPSLLFRLKEGDDEAAWEEFVAIYRPVIVRLAMLKGLQHCDAEDLAQQVLISVSKSIPKWEQDAHRARFRTWLQKVVRNATLNALTRTASERAVGGTSVMSLLNSQPAHSHEDSALFDLEWRREAFRWAADQVREEFQPATWEAFWLTAVEGLTAQEAAERVKKSAGAVYVARSRVMQRIQSVLSEMTQSENPNEKLSEEAKS